MNKVIQQPLIFHFSWMKKQISLLRSS